MSEKVIDFKAAVRRRYPDAFRGELLPEYAVPHLMSAHLPPEDRDRVGSPGVFCASCVDRPDAGSDPT